VTSKPHRLLGLDPGLTEAGAVVLSTGPRRLRLITVERLMPPARADLGTKLLVLYTGVTRLLTRHRITAVAIEDHVYFPRFHRGLPVNGLLTARLVIGVLVGAVLSQGLPVQVLRGEEPLTAPALLLNPARVKAALTGRATASKADVRRALQASRWFREDPLPRLPSEHCQDALAVAVAALILWRKRTTRSQIPRPSGASG